MVPDLHHLPICKPEDVDTRKLSRLAGGFNATPCPRVRASGSPAPRYQIAFSEDQINVPFQVWKGCPEVGRDLALSFGTGEGLGRAEVMAGVVLSEDLKGKVYVTLVPDLFLEPTHGISKGRARPYRAGVKGYIRYPIEDQEDVSVVLEILGRNYGRAKAAAERRGSQDAKE